MLKLLMHIRMPYLSVYCILIGYESIKATLVEFSLNSNLYLYFRTKIKFTSVVNLQSVLYKIYLLILLLFSNLEIFHYKK